MLDSTTVAYCPFDCTQYLQQHSCVLLLAKPNDPVMFD